MILKVLVWLGSHVHIKPVDLFVVGADDEVVTAGVHIDGGDPFGAGLVLGHYHLLLKVVLKDLDMRTSEKVWARRMETDRLNDTFGLRKRPIRVRPT